MESASNDLALTQPESTPTPDTVPPLPARPSPDPTERDEPRVPPSEPADAWALDKARKELSLMRERATKAEESAGAAQGRARALEDELASARAQAQAAERGRRIDEELVGVGAIDLETTRLLAEAAALKAESPDVGQIVRDLRRRKPFLFRGTGAGGPTAARFPEDTSARTHESIDEVSEEARASGDRLALLRYLRLKRGV